MRSCPTTACKRRRFRSAPLPRLTPGVDMIDIANGCAKKTYKSDLWRNRYVNHHYFLICTQGKSSGLGSQNINGVTRT
jgi:hypothetical protein